MPDKPFVINDRRKFTSEGEVRPGVELDRKPAEDSAPKDTGRKVTGTGAPIPPPTAEAPTAAGPQAVPPNNVMAMPSRHEEPAAPEAFAPEAADNIPPPPTAEQTASATRAYDATVDRLDTALRAANPGAERPPDMNFERFIQSLYMQAIIQLGGMAEPGQQPQVDIFGARQTIDMLGILAAKTQGNLSKDEQSLLDSAVFEARMAFLEMTQALARQAAGKQPPMPSPPGGGPSIVR